MCKLKPARIVIVEDDASLRAALGVLLDTCEYRCDSFDSAEAFLAGSEMADIDCVVLDVDLPGADGLAAQRRMALRGIDVPILFISGTADSAQIARARRAGAFDFLEKPFDPECLLERIEHAVLAPRRGRGDGGLADPAR